MNVEEKKRKIETIVSHLKHRAKNQDKPFDEGGVLISLAFKSDEQLNRIYEFSSK
jgi:hypothetical protein